MRQALLDALQGFEGTVVLVSHDRALLRSVCDAFWLVQQHRVDVFEGDLEDYQTLVLQQAKNPAAAVAAPGGGGGGGGVGHGGSKKK